VFRRSADGIFPTQNYSAVGISPIRSQSFRYWDFSYSEVIVNYSAAGISPTQSRSFCWDFSHLEATVGYSAARISPLGVGPSAAGIFPTRRIVFKRSANGIFLTRNYSVAGIFPTRNWSFR